LQIWSHIASKAAASRAVASKPVRMLLESHKKDKYQRYAGYNVMCKYILNVHLVSGIAGIKRKRRCGSCDAYSKDDCGHCTNCQDMKKIWRQW